MRDEALRAARAVAAQAAPGTRARAVAASGSLRNRDLRPGAGAGVDPAQRSECQGGYVGGSWDPARRRPGQAGAAGAPGGHARIEAPTGRRGGAGGLRYRTARRRAGAAPAVTRANPGPGVTKGSLTSGGPA